MYALFNPSYRVLSLHPDRFVGWKQVPKLQWTWAGHHWYARDFSVQIRTNSHGFRDAEREYKKEDGVIRIALLGDSFVEAAQVPFEKTAGALLEQRLNERGNSGRHPVQRYEVLNFGISNYGVGQYLLTWEQYTSHFDPDYVFIFLAGVHMERSVKRDERGAFPSTRKKQLWVRPTFRLENGRLIREKAKDFNEFVNLQEELIWTRFGHTRMVRRKGSFIYDWARQLKWILTNMGNRRADAQKATSDLNEDTIRINLKIIEELAKGVEKSGGRLVVADVSRYLEGSTSLSRQIKRFCEKKQIGYLALSDYLLKINKNNIPTRWKYDGHFNEAGNEVFANAMYEWIAKETFGVPNRGWN